MHRKIHVCRRPCRTGKTRYGDQQSAKRALVSLQSKSQRDLIPLRVYRCEFCGDFHFTSRTERGLDPARVAADRMRRIDQRIPEIRIVDGRHTFE